jgi:short-subunit dehydrogenase
VKTSPTKTALVTGASRGIGRGICRELAGQGYGLTVTSRAEEDLVALAEELRDLGAAQVVYRAADLADRDSLPELVWLHHNSYRTMDALLLSGGVGTAALLERLPAHLVDKTLSVNFISAVTLVQHALPHLRAAAAASPGGARVIFLSSIAGVYAEPGLAAYGAAKAALISLAETVNAEESGNGVMATALAPAYVDTEMSAWTIDTVPAETMIPVSDVVAVVRMLLGLGRTTAIPRIVLSRSGTSGYGA